MYIDDKSSIDSNYNKCNIFTNEDKTQNIGNAGLITYTNDLGKYKYVCILQI